MMDCQASPAVAHQSANRVPGESIHGPVAENFHFHLDQEGKQLTWSNSASLLLTPNEHKITSHCKPPGALRGRRIG